MPANGSIERGKMFDGCQVGIRHKDSLPLSVSIAISTYGMPRGHVLGGLGGKASGKGGRSVAR